uniref:MADF domain-containing protein n=1 Tax=Clastoptera arizonana TaxID=38151 RepID=A0A1B6D3F3_9HEMI
MDIPSLIVEVRQRPALWDQRCKNHCNRHVTDELWGEVASALNTPKNVVKGKWKGLRDTFRYVLKKVHPEAEEADPKWPYFKPLLFLKEQMSPYRVAMKEQFGDADDDGFQDHEDTQSSTSEPKYDTDSPVIPDGLVSVQLGTPSQEYNPGYRGAKRKAPGDETMDPEAYKGQDYHFFMSLIPHMRNISGAQKLLTYIEIQKLIYKDAYGDEINEDSSISENKQ